MFKLLATALLVASFTLGQTQLVSRVFTRTTPYVANASHVFNHAVVLSSGEFVVGGTINGVAHLAFHSRSGSLLKLVSLASQTDSPTAITELVPIPSGGLYVVGTVNGSFFVAMKFNAARNVVWRKVENFGGVEYVSTRSAAIGPNENLYVCGGGGVFFSNVAALTVLSNAGAPLLNYWSPYDITAAQYYNDVVADAAGNAFVGGDFGGNMVAHGISLAGAKLGEFVTFRPPVIFTSVCLLKGGQGFIATGQSASRFLVYQSEASFASSGFRYSDSSSLRGGKFALALSTGFVLAGTPPTPDFQLTRYGTSLVNRLWNYSYGIANNSYDDLKAAIVDQFDETYLLGATSANSGQADASIALMKINSAGTRRWTQTWAPQPGLQSIPGAIALHPISGDILVIGENPNGQTENNIALAIYRQAPIALADVYVLPMNTPFYVSPRTLTANDRMWQGALASLVQGPANGTLTLRSNGTFDYVPNAGYVGNDPWTYRLTKPLVGTTTAIVTMAVRQ